MTRVFRRAATMLVLVWPKVAHAHPGHVPEPHDLWHAWTFAPFVVLALLVSSAWYALGVRALWSQAGTGRGARRIEVGAFALGLITIAVALLSPIDAVSEALFSVHMVQHLLLVLVAAPLLMYGIPQYVMLWTLPSGRRRAVVHWWHGARPLRSAWNVLRNPLVAWTLHVAVLWVWHTPRLYDAALRDGRVHVMEHSLFLLTALLFWWVVMRGRLSLGASTLYLFAAALQGTLLGALLSIARHPWYVGHYGTTGAWGLTPIEDQQIAGLIMWVPAGLVYLLALVPGWVRVLTRRELNGGRLVFPQRLAEQRKIRFTAEDAEHAEESSTAARRKR